MLKIYELKDTEPFRIIRCSNEIEPNRIQMQIFTDGEIKKEDEETSIDIKKYYFGKQLYRYDVNELHVKDIYFKNYSFIIAYKIAQVWTNFGNLSGWFDTIKDTSISLRDPSDKNALKNAKQALREIQKYNNSVKYSSVFDAFGLQGMDLKKFEFERLSSNVYSLRRKGSK